jgi:arylsulfatase
VARHNGPWELYDLAADRTEMNNRADRQPEKVKELTGLYDAWAKRANVLPWGELPRPQR